MFMKLIKIQDLTIKEAQNGFLLILCPNLKQSVDLQYFYDCNNSDFLQGTVTAFTEMSTVLETSIIGRNLTGLCMRIPHGKLNLENHFRRMPNYGRNKVFILIPKGLLKSQSIDIKNDAQEIEKTKNRQYEINFLVSSKNFDQMLPFFSF